MQIRNLSETVVLKYCDLTFPVDLSDIYLTWNKINSDGRLTRVITGGRFSINYKGWLIIENVESSDLGTYRVKMINDRRDLGIPAAIHRVLLEVK